MIVAAALIMGTVFAAFILSADRISKEFGILLAVAILTDALLMRLTLVPAFWSAARREDVVHPELAGQAPPEPDDRGAARARGHRSRADRAPGRDLAAGPGRAFGSAPVLAQDPSGASVRPKSLSCSQ